MLRFLAILPLLAGCHVPPEASRLEQLRREFVGEDAVSVVGAGEALQNYERDGLSVLIGLLDDPRHVPLLNTEPLRLAYPGARKSHPHAWRVEYELDCLPARAAWRIEEVTYLGFGFARCDGTHFRMEAARIKEWWAKVKDTWTRRQAWLEVLRKGDDRQFRDLARQIERARREGPGANSSLRRGFYGDVLPLLVELRSPIFADVLLGDYVESALWELDGAPPLPALDCGRHSGLCPAHQELDRRFGSETQKGENLLAFWGRVAPKARELDWPRKR